MLKQKEYDILNSNIAGLGTDLEKNVRAAAAACEKEWKNAGKKEGLQIWRIEKFQVVPWAKEEYGHFYDGDSYIILKTTKVENKLVWDVHFWLGLSTSQDEAGTAAYKTVELDDYLGTFPTQHREVQGNESELFLSYFPNNAITILSGGVDSGFNHVTPEEYRTRLLHIKGTAKSVRILECDLSVSSLNSGDIFLLDKGLEVYQMNGAKSSGGERMRAGQLARAIDHERKGEVTIKVAEQGDGDADFWPVFWEALGGKGKISDKSGCDEDAAAEASETKKLFCLKEDGGDVKLNQVSFDKKNLDSSDVFIMDQGNEIFVWVGKNASEKERKGGLQHAQNYLSKYKRPLALPITRIMEGGERELFNTAFENKGKKKKGGKKKGSSSKDKEKELNELLGMFGGLLAPGVGPCVVGGVFVTLILLFLVLMALLLGYFGEAGQSIHVAILTALLLPLFVVFAWFVKEAPLQVEKSDDKKKN